LSEERGLGLFITIEGIDGAGKSTQAEMLSERLKRAAQPVIRTQEPGGTFFGDFIRELIKRDVLLRRAGRAVTGGRGTMAVDATAELLLFEAARAQLVAEVIRPWLETGGVVICDRYADSTLAYQGYGRGLALETIEVANALATGGLKPDLTLLLEVPVEVGLSRYWGGDHVGKQAPGKHRFEKEDVEFHQRVREGYLKLARAEPERWVVIDGTSPPDEIAARIWEVVRTRLGPVSPGDVADRDETIVVKE